MNSNMLPHGPRPTTIPRSSNDATRMPKPMAVRPTAARPSGVGEAASSGPVATADVRLSAKTRSRRLPTPAGGSGRRLAIGGRSPASRRGRRGRQSQGRSRSSRSGRGVARSGRASRGLACHATAAPPGGGTSVATIRVRGSIFRTRPQLPQVSMLASRTSSHFGHRTDSGVLSRSQRVAPNG